MNHGAIVAVVANAAKSVSLIALSLNFLLAIKLTRFIFNNLSGSGRAAMRSPAERFRGVQLSRPAFRHLVLVKV